MDGLAVVGVDCGDADGVGLAWTGVEGVGLDCAETDGVTCVADGVPLVPCTVTGFGAD